MYRWTLFGHEKLRTEDLAFEVPNRFRAHRKPTPQREILQVDKAMNRALVVFADKHKYLIDQLMALHESLLYSNAIGTDLICFGPKEVLEKLPNSNQLVKIEQAPHPYAHHHNYGYINSLSCLNGEGSDLLLKYSQILKTDVDTFVTPAWTKHAFQGFHCGQGAYAHDAQVKEELMKLSQKFGLSHRGKHNLGSTLVGEPSKLREVCALATQLTEYLLDVEFVRVKGAWPGWFWGVSSMYATEVALNHLIPDITESHDLLDFPSHQDASVLDVPHIHCWQTREHFSKLNWIDDLYSPAEENKLNLARIPDYCQAMSQRAAGRLQSP